jgi:hypothetical protein
MLDGAACIWDLENVTWLNGREFSDLQFENWMRYLRSRGFKEDETGAAPERPGIYAVMG